MNMNLFRNITSVYRRYRWATWLNVLGLSLAFAGLYIGVKQAWFEFSYDRSYPGYDRIYRMEQVSSKGCYSDFVLPFLRQTFRDAPNIECAGICESFSRNGFCSLPEQPEQLFKATTTRINRGFTDVFGFRFLEGSADGLDEVDKKIVLIPESLARQRFGGTSALGRQININDEWLTVTGVYADFPQNATLTNDIYFPLLQRLDNENSWEIANYNAYVKLFSSEQAESVLKEINYPEDFLKSWEFLMGTGIKPRLFPVKDLYFYSQMGPVGDIQKTGLLLGAIVLILSISVINFVNFSMALAPTRIRSINTQKVMGASLASLRAGVLGEAVFLAILAFLLALVEIQLLSYTTLTRLFLVDISLLYLPVTLLLSAGCALVVGLVAGLWPAFYITSVPMAIALKGSFYLSPKGVRIRNLMIGFQFFITFILISQTLFVYLQNRYMLRAPLGFDKENVVAIEMAGCIQSEVQVQRFFEQLRSYAGTEKLFTSGGLILNSGDSYQSWGDRDRNISLNVLPVDPSFLDGLGIKVTEGRPFRPDDASKAVINLSAKQKHDLKPGDMFHGNEIVGIIPDIKLLSCRKANAPFILICGDQNYFVAYVKLKQGVDSDRAKAYVRDAVKELGPLWPFVRVTMLDDVAAKMYEKELNEAQVVTLLCLSSLLIAVMGVFGLVIFEAQARRKEISLRKINGATVGEIVFLFNRSFLVIVLICFVISLPLAYYAASHWLEQFVYRIPVYNWVFAVSLCLVLVVTAFVVTLQCWRTATMNPVKSIQNE